MKEKIKAFLLAGYLLFVVGVIIGAVFASLYLPTPEEKTFLENYQRYGCGAFHKEGWKVTEFKCEEVGDNSSR